MTNFNLISSLMRGLWAIDESEAYALSPLVASILSGSVDANRSIGDNNIRELAVDGGIYYSYANGFDGAKPGSVAIVPIKGALMKDDMPCGPMGMSRIGSILKEVDANPNLIGAVLHTDSPGGTVDGTENLAKIVSNMTKPVVTYVDGLMASAALWIGLSSDEVIASSEMDRVGSIGVMLSFADYKPALEREGVKFHNIKADQSSDKNKVYEDILNGDYKGYKEKFLNPLADRFISAVRGSSPKVEDKHLTGDVWFAKDVQGVFVDNFGDLDYAIDRVKSMAISGKIKGLKSGNTKTNELMASKVASINDNFKNVKMTRDQLKNEHPDVYAEVVQEGVASERDRVGAFMAFSESSPEAVKEAIEKGEAFTARKAAEFSAAMTKHVLSQSEKTPTSNAVVTGEAPIIEESAADRAEKEANEAMRKLGLTIKS